MISAPDATNTTDLDKEHPDHVIGSDTAPEIQSRNSADNQKIQLSEPKLIKRLVAYITVLATLYTIYIAKIVLLPVVVASFIALFSTPGVRYLTRLGVPRQAGTILVMCLLLALAFAVALLLATPAQHWYDRLPELLNTVSHNVSQAARADGSGNSALDELNHAINNEQGHENLRQHTAVTLLQEIATSAPLIMMQFMVTLFLIYFFLSHGQQLLTSLIRIQHTFSEKRRIVELYCVIQRELSTYILTITLINIGLGLTVGCVFYYLGLEDPFLWGAVAGVLNFAPYVGPLISATSFCAVAYLQFNSLDQAIFIPSLYLAINLFESQFITPTLLGRNLNLNPLIVFVWLIIWGWLWGSFGLLTGVPLLVCFSIYLERTRIVGDWYQLLQR